MADELDNFITALTTKFEEVTGVVRAPEHPPEKLNEFPIVICYYVSGTFNYSAGGPCIGMHRVHGDLHLSRSNLPHDEEFARPFILRVLAKVADNLKMSSTCEHCLLTEYQYGGLNYGTDKTFGVRFIFEVKIKHSGITVSV